LAIGLRARPTRGFLLELKKKIQITEEGYRILSHKRDELVSKLRELLELLRAIRKDILKKFQEILKDFRNGYALIGPEEISAYTLSTKGKLDIQILPMSVMGVIAPKVKARKIVEIKNSFPPLIRQFAYYMSEILQDLIKLGEIETGVEIIANDLERTNRTVNALEKIIIPQLKAIAKYIQDLIEEEDLEEFTRIKLVRNIIVRRREK